MDDRHRNAAAFIDAFLATLCHLQFDRVVWGVNPILLGAEVLFPGINRHPYPGRRWNRPDAMVFANEVDDAPPTVPLLNTLECQRSYFRPAAHL
jgi:hypothetical protein